MFKLVCKKIPLWRPAFSFSLNQDLGFLQLHNFSTLSKKIPKSDTLEDDKRLFVINYLKQECGMSQEKAESASGYITFKTLQNHDSVISFFKKQGFTGTQISNLIIKYPYVIRMNPDKILLPKIEFFRSLGLSTKDIIVMLSNAHCKILGRSLEKQIIPLFRYISTLLESHELTLVCIRRYCLILSFDLENVVIPNVEYLSEVGVPRENVVRFLRTYPEAISYQHDRFRKAVDEVNSMGFNPMKAYFPAAVFAFGWNNESTWRKKMGVYKSFGLCDSDVIEAFRKEPFCMMPSADKILKTMDFLFSKMGFEPSCLMKWPGFVSYSLQKRIVPRCVVYKALLAKDLVPKNFTLRLLLDYPEKKFLSTFVEPFEAQVPGLLLMYKNNSPVSR